MPLDPAKVGLAVQGGLSVVCATCSRYWEARDRHLPEPKCLAKEGCGSPLCGDDFHEYDGPITDFGRWCFVCGGEAKCGIRVQGRKRLVGVCGEHVRMLAELRPVNDLNLAVAREVRSGRSTVPVERLLAPRKKSLAAAILEVETYYAQKAGTRE